jgi:hypothetical protein
MVNTKIKPTANNIGVSKESEPFHIVASQLKIFAAVGTAINIVAYMKKSWPVTGIPTVNIWWAQTTKERIAIDAVAYTIEL